MTTQLREIKKTAEGETLYVLAFEEYVYGVSHYGFWREFVISCERGFSQMTGEGTVGGKLVYELVEKSVKPNKR